MLCAQYWVLHRQFPTNVSCRRLHMQSQRKFIPCTSFILVTHSTDCERPSLHLPCSSERPVEWSGVGLHFWCTYRSTIGCLPLSLSTLFFWDRISHCIWSLPFLLDRLVSPQDPPVLRLQNGATMPESLWVLGINSQLYASSTEPSLCLTALLFWPRSPEKSQKINSHSQMQWGKWTRKG